MLSEAVIKIKDISKSYKIYDQPHHRLLQMFAGNNKQYFKEFWAIRDVSFELSKGETLGVMGRNGSGKSTLLQIICGTLNPSTGSILTQGRIAALLELGSGFNPEFTGKENVYLNANILGLSKEETDFFYEDILSFADIGEFINIPVKTYSSGMALRLAFAVQAMINPEILIVDEALAVGDEKFQRKCFSRIEELKSSGTSIIFVSHSAPQIVELCDKAILLEGGRCLLEDSPANVVKEYQKILYSPLGEKLQSIEGLSDNSLADSNTRIEKNTSPDRFEVDLVPATTQKYPEQGARIKSFEIFNLDGQQVNILNSGSIYRFVMKGVFLNTLERVYFGVHIKSVSGTVITGQRFPEAGSSIDLVKRSCEFEISYEFRLALMPGTFFVGGGVWSSDPECAHRILDAIMFKVLPLEVQPSFGYCDLANDVPKLKIDQL